jgi:hypothetical protein
MSLAPQFTNWLRSVANASMVKVDFVSDANTGNYQFFEYQVEDWRKDLYSLYNALLQSKREAEQKANFGRGAGAGANAANANAAAQTPAANPNTPTQQTNANANAHAVNAQNSNAANVVPDRIAENMKNPAFDWAAWRAEMEAKTLAARQHAAEMRAKKDAEDIAAETRRQNLIQADEFDERAALLDEVNPVAAENMRKQSEKKRAATLSGLYVLDSAVNNPEFIDPEFDTVLRGLSDEHFTVRENVPFAARKLFR